MNKKQKSNVDRLRKAQKGNSQDVCNLLDIIEEQEKYICEFESRLKRLREKLIESEDCVSEYCDEKNEALENETYARARCDKYQQHIEGLEKTLGLRCSCKSKPCGSGLCISSPVQKNKDLEFNSVIDMILQFAKDERVIAESLDENSWNAGWNTALFKLIEKFEGLKRPVAE